MQDQGEFYINGENELTFYIQPERPKILIRPKTGCHPQRMRGFAWQYAFTGQSLHWSMAVIQCQDLFESRNN